MSAIEKAARAVANAQFQRHVHANDYAVARAAILAFLEDEGLVEEMARAIQGAMEQNGGPPYEALVLTGGKHALANLYDEARASLAALRTLVTEDETK